VPAIRLVNLVFGKLSGHATWLLAISGVIIMAKAWGMTCLLPAPVLKLVMEFTSRCSLPNLESAADDI